MTHGESAGTFWQRQAMRLDEDLATVRAQLRASEARVRLAEAALSAVTFVGHGDECLFCGFKDRAVADYEKRLEAAAQEDTHA